MKTKYNVSVTLTPLEHYFFGDENLNTDGTEKYYQRSLQLPQQTTVLGAMRFLLLQISGSNIFNGHEIIDKAKAKEIIGDTSFDMSQTQYGKISSISEVLLWHETNGFYLPMLAWKDKKVIDTSIQEKTDKCFFGCGLEKPSFSLPNYIAKEGIQLCWINKNGEAFDDNIFTEYRHAGNHKNKENKMNDDDDAYFKMCYYRLNSRFSFVFNMCISDEQLIRKLIEKKRIVYIGGERSKFICTIDELSTSNQKQITEEVYESAYSTFADNLFTKVILTSDAFIDSNPYQNSLFAVTQIKKLRFMQSTVEKTNAYGNREQEREESKKDKSDRIGLKQSRLFNVLQKGSVFYFEKNANIENFLRYIPCETIGYNKYYKL
ncbi:hypothetical protein FACS1894155_07080 [Bacteroidia bacterium]|nr:hypothetical protein FACS1894155_07080 [Bacteroidia bacterium]